MHRRAAAVLGVAALSVAALGQPAIFQTLPANSVAYDVSADGGVMVGARLGRAFRWTEATGMVDLGPGIASGISADGHTVAGADEGSLFRWTSAGGRIDAPITSRSNWARVSADGSTVAAVSHGGAAWRWASGNPGQLPGPPGYPTTAALALNASGSVIVGSTYTARGHEPAVWVGSAAPVTLGTLLGAPYDGQATVVTADGQTVFGFSRAAAGYDVFRWTAATGMVGLGINTAGFPGLPVPKDITPDGSILVGETFGAAFVWTQGSGPELLQDVLTNQYGLNLGGLSLHSALGVSADGRVLVGFADGPTGGVAYRVQLPWPIPAPATLAVLLAAAAPIARRRRATEAGA